MKLIIYEMVLRDGLQSMDKIYDLNQKYLIYNHLINSGINKIEFGSTTSEKILPQMKESIDLYKKIFREFDRAI